jgi:hypothetical protein
MAINIHAPWFVHSHSVVHTNHLPPPKGLSILLFVHVFVTSLAKFKMFRNCLYQPKKVGMKFSQILHHKMGI